MTERENERERECLRDRFGKSMVITKREIARINSRDRRYAVRVRRLSFDLLGCSSISNTLNSQSLSSVSRHFPVTLTVIESLIGSIDFREDSRGRDVYVDKRGSERDEASLRGVFWRKQLSPATSAQVHVQRYVAIHGSFFSSSGSIGCFS